MKKVFFVVALFLIIGMVYANTCNIYFAQPTDDQLTTNDIIGSGCRTLILTPQQVESIKQNYLLQGIRPSTLYTGKVLPQKKEKDDKTPKNKINLVSGDKSMGISLELPDKGATPDVLNPEMHEECKGDFAYALVLDETLRVGRCFPSPQDINSCSVTKEGLKYRNDDSAFEILKKSLSQVVPGNKASRLSEEKEEKEEIEVPNKLSKEDLKYLENVDPSLKDAGYFKMKRKEFKLLKNSIMTDSFNGEFQSVCSGQDASERCKVILLSYFDKYYNSYYSGILVATTAGPAVIGVSKSIVSKLEENHMVAAALENNPFAEITKAFKKGKDKILTEMFRKDVEMQARNIEKYITNFDAMGLTELRKLLDTDIDSVVGGKALSVFNEKVAKELAKDPNKAKVAYELMQKRYQYMKNYEDALAHADDFIERAEITNIMSKHPRIIGYDPNKKFLSKNKQYLSFVKRKNGQTVPVDNFEVADSVFRGKLYKEHEAFVNEYKKLEKSGLKHSDIIKRLEKKGIKPVFYKVDPNKLEKLESEIRPEDLEDFVKKVKDSGTEYYYKTNDGGLIHVTEDTVKDIIDDAGGPITLYKNPANNFVPDPDFPYKSMLEDYVGFVDKGNIAFNMNNTKEIMDAMIAQGLVPKRHANVLNWWLYNNKYKWNKVYLLQKTSGVLAPLAYWKMKTTDTLNGTFKAYFIGKGEYDNVAISLGPESVYNDAYMDIFADAPVNNGDFFGMIFRTFGSISESIIGEGSRLKEIAGIVPRDEVQHIILYTGTKNNCPDCISSYNIANSNAVVNARSFADTVNYVLELPDADTFISDGLTLAVFAHHTNIDMKVKDLKQQINIQKAIQEQNTCIDRAKSMAFLGSFDYLTDVPSRMGIPLGIVDSYSWMLAGFVTPFGLPNVLLGMGISWFISNLTQRTFEDCVDAEDGYYIQYLYRQPNKDTFTKVNKLLSTGSAKLNSGNKDKLTDAMNKIKEKTLQMVNSRDKEYLQFNFNTFGTSHSKLESNSIFLTWIKGGAYCSPSDYDDKGKLIGKDGKHTMELDKENQTLKVDGKLVVKSPLLRLATRNYIVGAEELPHAATFIPAIGDKDFFEVNTNLHVKVISEDALNCISDGLEQQVGKSLKTSDLASVLGLMQSLTTSKGVKLYPNKTGGLLLSGGELERTIIKGKSVIVNKKAHVVASVDGKDYDLGELRSIIFDKGVLLYAYKEKEFILWARISSQMLGTDVKSLKSDVVNVKNPITNCDEYAIDLSVIANPNDFAAGNKAKEFNKALKKAGPYQYFETPDKTFIFYSKLVDGECKSYMKVIDKKTKQVIVDSEIANIRKTKDGFDVTTKDGKTHKFEFSSENGRPFLSYNGEKDLLLLAQGRNGSFYFDPNTGKWTVSNSHMLPLDDRFRTMGERNIGGIATPSGNPVYAASKTFGKEGGFNIPLIPKNQRVLFILLSVFIAIGIFFYTNK